MTKIFVLPPLKAAIYLRTGLHSSFFFFLKAGPLKLEPVIEKSNQPRQKKRQKKITESSDTVHLFSAAL